MLSPRGKLALAVSYRQRQLRSLSVGDVVTIDQDAFSCESVGWEQRKQDELRFLLPSGVPPGGGVVLR